MPPLDADLNWTERVNAARSVQTLRFSREEEPRAGELIAIFFDEKAADECAEFLTDRFPLPEGIVISVCMESVHPDELERWARGEFHESQ